jgi:hypothetical protein
MADISQTAANVKLISTGPFGNAVAGEAITQGQPFYLASGSAFRCDANDGAAKAVAVGIALTPATTGQTFLYALPGATVDVGATLTVAAAYIVSENVGAIAPIADLATNSYLTILGVATAAGSLYFDPLVSGVQKPA